MSSVTPQFTLGITNLFTRIIPGIILVLTGTVVYSFIELIQSDSAGSTSSQLITAGSLSFSDILILIVIVSLILGEIIHLISENIITAPPYFREIHYRNCGEYGVLGPLQRRKMMKREAAKKLKNNESAEHPTMIQQIKFRLLDNYHLPSLESISCIRDLRQAIMPTWLTSGEPPKGYTRSDFEEVLERVKIESNMSNRITNPSDLYIIFCKRMENVESVRTKQLRVRYQAFRNIKISVYFSIFISIFTVLYIGVLSGTFLLVLILTILLILIAYLTLLAVHMIGDITSIERQYINSMFIEYLYHSDRKGLNFGS